MKLTHREYGANQSKVSAAPPGGQALLRQRQRNKAQPEFLKNLQTAASQINVAVTPLEASTSSELESPFARMAREKLRAVTPVDPLLALARRHEIAELALRYRLPTIFGGRMTSRQVD